jgi:arginine deiminase
MEVSAMDHSMHNFLYPRAPYHGPIQPGHLVFNANLQEFAHRVSYISNLNTNGKLTADEALAHIQYLWETLKHSRVGLQPDRSGE